MILYEAAVSIPIIAMLAMTAVAVSLWGMKVYFLQLADGELEQEVQMAFQRVVEDALTAEEIKIEPKGSNYVFVKKKNPLKNVKDTAEDLAIRYWVNEVDGAKKLVRIRENFPLTGDHALAGVDITEFTISPDLQWPGIYHIRMTGKSGVTHHEYSLYSAVYVPAR